MAGNPAGRRRTDRLSGRGVAPRRKRWIADRAARDAFDLGVDVRDLDPVEVWGRLVRWQINDPERLVACAVALAAMLPVDDASPVELLAWLDRPYTDRAVAS